MAKHLKLVDRRIAVVSVALKKSERVALTKLAAEAGHTMSDHIRALIVNDWDRRVAESDHGTVKE